MNTYLHRIIFNKQRNSMTAVFRVANIMAQ